MGFGYGYGMGEGFFEYLGMSFGKVPIGVKVFGCVFGLGCGQPTPRTKWLSILSTIDCTDRRTDKHIKSIVRNLTKFQIRRQLS